MNKTVLSIIFFFLLTLSGFAQNTKENFLQLIKEKQYEAAEKMINDVVAANPKDYKILAAAGEVYSELEKYEQSVSYYKKAYDIEDGDAALNRKYAIALADAKNFKEAIKLIRETIKDDPKDLMNHIAASDILIKADSLSEAEIEIDRAKEIDPENPISYVALGNFYFARRVYELARQNYEKAIELDPNNVEAHFKLATSYYWLGTRELDKDLSNELFTRSLKEWNVLSKLDSNNAKAFFEQGKIWFFSDRYNEAATALARYVKLRPSGSLGRWYFAQSLYKLGDCENAIPNLEICAKEIDTVKVQAEQNLAECYLTTKQYDKAKKVYEDLQTQNVPFQASDFRKYGQAAFFDGDTTGAINLWEKTIDMDKDGNCLLMYYLGTLLSTTKDFNNSNKYLKMHLETGACQDSANAAMNPKVYYVIGTNYIFSNQPDSALVYLNKAHELDPENVFAEIYLADANIQLKNSKAAIEIYKSIITRAESDSTVNINAVIQAYAKYCNLLLDAKNYQELNKFAKKWTEATPENPYAFLYYAVSFQGLGDMENACKNYGKVLKLDPGNTTAKKNRELMNCK